MKPAVFHPEASAGALDARATYDAKRFELGDRFAAAVAAMVAEVCRGGSQTGSGFGVWG